MAARAPSQVHVETLIARGRLVLAVFLLLVLWVRAPRDEAIVMWVGAMLLGYWAVLVAACLLYVVAALAFPSPDSRPVETD